MKANYKNWVPKGLIVAMGLATLVSLGAFLLFGAWGLWVAESWRIILGILFAIATLVCGIILHWSITASFERNLTAVFRISKADAKGTMAKAKGKYKELIGKLPEFEKGDRFRMNIVGCAMLGAVVLSMPARPDVETLTVYYRQSMMTVP